MTHFAITVARKPLSEGSVARNVLKHGTGSLNIDGTRIRTADTVVTNARRDSGRKEGRNIYDGGDRKPLETHQTEGQKLGRWPANFILAHKPECRRVGTKKVKSQNPEFVSSDKGSSPMFGLGVRPQGVGIGYADPDGTETIDAWECVPGCPVAAIDEQSGVSVSSGGRIGNAEGAYTKLGSVGWSGAHRAGDPGFGDEGGASRYFKQVGGQDDVAGD